MVKSFIKWAGGKSKQAEHIASFIPPTATDVFEGFAGSGALSFHLWNTRANHSITRYVLNDINSSLIKTYNSVFYDAENLMRMLDDFKFAHETHKRPFRPEEGSNEVSHEWVLDREDHYYLCRKMFNKERERVSLPGRFDNLLAALFIFLNKTSFNGLFRTNNIGNLNTPWGQKMENFNLYDRENLQEISKIKGFEFYNMDFRKITKAIRHGNSCVYFDPVYRPVEFKSEKSFTKYNAAGFNDTDQIALKNLCDKLNKKDVTFIVSNSFSKDGFFQELYKDYRIIETKEARSINSNGEGRGKVKGLLITNSKEGL